MNDVLYLEFANGNKSNTKIAEFRLKLSYKGKTVATWPAKVTELLPGEAYSEDVSEEDWQADAVKCTIYVGDDVRSTKDLSCPGKTAPYLRAAKFAFLGVLSDGRWLVGVKLYSEYDPEATDNVACDSDILKLK
jgi:hypothetical protein